MALTFAKARVGINNAVGTFEEDTVANLPKDLKLVNNRPVVDCAIQSFKLDLTGGARPTDDVQVTASIKSAAGDSVTVQIKTVYSGGTYRGEVTALVIADLVD